MANNDGISNLRSAVIVQATQDYIDVKLQMEKSFDKLQELQDFFEGEQFELFNETELSGKDIMKNCDLIVESRLRKWRKKRKKEMAV